MENTWKKILSTFEDKKYELFFYLLKIFLSIAGGVLVLVITYSLKEAFSR